MPCAGMFRSVLWGTEKHRAGTGDGPRHCWARSAAPGRRIETRWALQSRLLGLRETGRSPFRVRSTRHVTDPKREHRKGGLSRTPATVDAGQIGTQKTDNELRDLSGREGVC